MAYIKIKTFRISIWFLYEVDNTFNSDSSISNNSSHLKTYIPF